MSPSPPISALISTKLRASEASVGFERRVAEIADERAAISPARQDFIADRRAREFMPASYNRPYPISTAPIDGGGGIRSNGYPNRKIDGSDVSDERLVWASSICVLCGRLINTF